MRGQSESVQLDAMPFMELLWEACLYPLPEIHANMYM